METIHVREFMDEGFWDGIPKGYTGIAIDSSGNKASCQNGVPHRLDAPAIEWANGKKWWIVFGVHSTKRKAQRFKKFLENTTFEKLLIDGLRDVPNNFTGVAYNISGDRFWHQNGKLHRLNLPAQEFASGDKSWLQNDKLHRLNGPAMEFVNGDKYWFIFDIELTESQFNIFRWLWEHSTYEKTDKLAEALVKLCVVKS